MDDRRDHFGTLGIQLLVLGLMTGMRPGEALAQPDPVRMRNPDGVVACLVSRPATPPERASDPDADHLIIELRAPATPAAAIVARLPASTRDFSTLPIAVTLVASAREDMTAAPKLRRIQPRSVDPSLVRPTLDGKPSPDLFIRVTYPRDVLRPGIDLLAERTAVAANGEKVTSQTRCRITEADAASWR